VDLVVVISWWIVIIITTLGRTLNCLLITIGENSSATAGYYYEGLQPILILQSGDTLDWELPTMAAQCECSIL
jgi:hypothetical protein